MPIAVLALLAGACDGGPTPEEQAARDAQDIARVEAAQSFTPDIRPLSLQPISQAEMAQGDRLGAGCVFLPERERASVIVLALHDAAYIKLDGEIRTLAADKGSAPLAPESWTRYQGREHVLDLQTPGDDARPSGEEAMERTGRVTIRDPYDRVVYSTAGVVRCHA